MNVAVFLDRDGVINEVLSERVKFVNTAEDFYLLPGAGEGIKKLNDAGYRVYVVTNQGGIGLGYMSEEALEAVHQEIEEQLTGFDAVIDDIAYCPHMPQSGCRCRKPKPGMLLDLAKKHDIDLSGSYMVGDREPDIGTGRNAGTKTIFIGKDKKQKVKADKNFPDLLSFADWLSE